MSERSSLLTNASVGGSARHMNDQIVLASESMCYPSTHTSNDEVSVGFKRMRWTSRRTPVAAANLQVQSNACEQSLQIADRTNACRRKKAIKAVKRAK